MDEEKEDISSVSFNQSVESLFFLAEFIKTGREFIIAGHKEPDGDCIGSQLALRSALVRLGKKVHICSAGPFDRSEIRGLTRDFSPVPEDKQNAKLIIVDCTGPERTGSLSEELKGIPYAIIDHHASAAHPLSTKDFPVFVDPNMPSTTIIIEKIIASLGLELTEEEAFYLFFGLCTDTGFFRHLSEKDADAFSAAAGMVRLGASPKEIYRKINGGKSLNSRKLIGLILSRTESYFDGRLLVSYETLEDFKTYGYKERDSDHLIQMLQLVEGVEAIVIIRQECEDSCTVSLRSIDKIDVSKIAAGFSGGGHKNASGLTLQGDISYVIEIMLKSFKNIFK